MTYKGVEIDKPSVEMVRACTEAQNFSISADTIFMYWEKRDWRHNNKNNSKIKSVEGAVNLFYEKVYRTINKQRKKANKRKEGKLTKDSKTFKVVAYQLAEVEDVMPATKAKDTPTAVVSEEKEKSYTKTYNEYLKDPRWKAFRTFIFAVRGKSCEVCGATDHIQIHHPKYIFGRKPWEYTCNEVLVLCGHCHKKAHGIS